ncbi:MAG: serine hydrolase [Chitinophagaceae bacterium]
MQLRLLFLIILLCVTGITYAQQAPSGVDSVTRLVRQYYNEKNTTALYEMTNPAFRKALTETAFSQAMEGLNKQLGNINTTEFQSATDNVAKYKTSFTSGQVLALFIGLDKEGRLETLLFRPVEVPVASKTAPVPTSNPLATPLDKKVDSLIKPFISKVNTVGIVVGVLENGKTHVYGYGEMVKDKGEVPGGNTLFEIGSLSKTFTATLLADLVEKGKINLSDPVNKYLPDSIPALQFNGKPITIASLSNHSSGLPRMPGNIFFSSIPDNPYVKYDDAKLFAFLKRFKTTREPGAEYEYSNLAVGLLGVIIERVSGRSYEQQLKAVICKPLGLKQTTVTIGKTDSAYFAQGYDAQAQIKPVHSWEFISLAGAGAIRSGVNDLLLYAKAQVNAARTPLSKAIQLTHQQTFEFGQTRVALGWHINSFNNKSYMGHNGQTGGYCSSMLVDPVSGKAVVILINSNADMKLLPYQLIDWVQDHF